MAQDSQAELSRPPLRVLHVEDDALDGEMIARALEQSGLDIDVRRVATRREFLTAFTRDQFDLVLSDFSMPDFDGLTALTLTRERDPDVPFIFISGTIGEDRAADALRRGATDYILKDRLSRLVPAVQRALQERQERSARQMAEERTREQAALLDEAREAIVVRNLDGDVTYWNRGAERLYGWSPEEAVAGRAAVVPHVSGEGGKAWESVLRSGQWDGTLAQTTRDGRSLLVESHWTLLRRPDGQPRAVLMIGSDVTRARELESQLLRTQRLEMVGLLTSGIAHDLNNVLSPILMGIEVMRREVSGERGKRALSAMEVSAVRGGEIVHQVLTFTRGTSTRFNPLHTRDVIRETEKLVRASFPKNIVVDVRVPDNTWPVKGDPTQLQQVMLNLCVNARDAMPEGGWLTIDAENVPTPGDAGGDHVRICIADTGHGMSPELREKIFDPFFTTKATGTGIGLSTVASIVRRHGGFVEVKSTVDEGTAFSVFLPATRRPLPTQPPRAAPLRVGRGQTLLVVDDEASVREISREILETCGYRVLCAGDAPSAFDLYVEHEKDIAVVLADVVMPGVSGLEFIRAIAARTPRPRVILISGIADAAKDDDLAPVIRSSVRKPFTAEALLNAIAVVIDDGPEGRG